MQHQAKLLAAALPLLEVASDRGRGASPVAGGPGHTTARRADRRRALNSKRPQHPAQSQEVGALSLAVCLAPAAQLLNSKGEQIFYPVVDDTDRTWALRLERAIDCHRDLAEADLNGLQAEFERVLRTSREALAVGRRDDRLYIKSLQEQLESAHERIVSFASPELIQFNK